MSNIATTINVQIDKRDKEQVTEILQKLGISMSGLINMTIKQVIMRKSIPFEVSIPEEDHIHNYFSEKEIEEMEKELKYIENHLEEYKKTNKWKDLKKELLDD